jgi:MFS family permease
MTGAYRRLLLATTVSGLGDGARTFAFLWFAAQWTDDPRGVVLVLVAEQAPWLLATLPAGSLADRTDRRLIMCLSNTAAAVLAAGFAAALAEHITSIVMLASLGFLLSTARVMYYVAANALLPDLVRKDQLLRANARLAAVQGLTGSMAGPLLGALLCTTAMSLPFALDAASFAVAFVLLLRLPRNARSRSAAEPTPGHPNMLAGIRYLLGNRTLRVLSLVLGLVNLAMGAWLAVALLFASHILHLDATACGELACVSGVGAIAGAALAPQMVDRLGLRSTLSLVLFAAAAALAVGGTTSTTAVSAITLVVFAGSTMALSVVALSYQHNVVPAALLGRTLAAGNLIAITSLPVGTLAGGMVAVRLGLRAPILLGALLALGGLATVLIAVDRPSLRRRRNATRTVAQRQVVGLSARAIARTRAFPLARLAGTNPVRVAACLAAVVAVSALAVSSRPTAARPPSQAIFTVPTTPIQGPDQAKPSTAPPPSAVSSPPGSAPVSTPRPPRVATAATTSSRLPRPLPRGTGRPNPHPIRVPSTRVPSTSPNPPATADPTAIPTPTPTATPVPEPSSTPTSGPSGPAPAVSTPTSVEHTS